jgi:hypothetical protein
MLGATQYEANLQLSVSVSVDTRFTMRTAKARYQHLYAGAVEQSIGFFN